MEQSMWRRPPAIALLVAVLAAGGSVVSVAAATGDDGATDVTARVVPSPADAAAGGGESGAEPPRGTAGTLRPRWVAPRRGEGTADAIGPARDWRRTGRVVVHAIGEETRLASVVAGMLERLGARDVERRDVAVAAATDQVRFFHAEDAAMAAELAATLEPLFGEVQVRDLTFYRPQPDAGALEVWLR